MSFVPVITAERPLLSLQTHQEILDAYRALFPGMDIEVNLIENMIETGHQLTTLARVGASPQPEVFVTAGCFSILNKPAEALMCHYSRCIQRVDGRIRFYPCPVIYDDARFELGATLQEFFRRVYVAHQNCYRYCMHGRGATCRTKPV